MQMIFEEKKELQTNLFYIMAIAASVVNACGCFLNAYLYGMALPTKICVFSGIIILVISIIGLFLKNKKWAIIGILVTVIWIEFPLLYFVYNNVILVYFILSIMGIIVFFPGKFKIIFSIVTLAWDVIIMFFSYLYPRDLELLNEKDMVVFSVCSYLIVAITLFCILYAVNRIYERQKKEIEKANELLYFMATHDPLTKLYNREYLMRDLEKRTQNDGACFVAAILDIDNFKSINDNYGHTFGDHVLVSFAKMIEKEIEGKGFAARYGGEEFMMIFESNNREDVLQVLHKISKQLNDYFLEEKNLSVTFSGGLEIYTKGMELEELIKNADCKLYEAKRNGKNQVT